MLPKLLLILLAIGLFEPVLLAQDKCTLTVKSLPAVRKLRLGMTLSQIRAIYPTMRTEKLGYMETWFEPAIKNPDPDVRGIGLTIENNKLVSPDISYQPTIQWVSGEEFAYQFMTNLGVPHPKKELASFTSSDDKEGFMVIAKIFIFISRQTKILFGSRLKLIIFGTKFVKEKKIRNRHSSRD
ncbi:MAG: hypothetical protein IPG67_05030 [Acidobacteria bacterium]|nr:hypothetical protein [Acidobacteriota bacterium]